MAFGIDEKCLEFKAQGAGNLSVRPREQFLSGFEQCLKDEITRLSSKLLYISGLLELIWNFKPA